MNFFTGVLLPFLSRLFVGSSSAQHMPGGIRKPTSLSHILCCETSSTCGQKSDRNLLEFGVESDAALEEETTTLSRGKIRQKEINAEMTFTFATRPPSETQPQPRRAGRLCRIPVQEPPKKSPYLVARVLHPARDFQPGRRKCSTLTNLRSRKADI